jgi:transposase InsO family protein
MLTDEEILKYYVDKNFPGSFASAKNLQWFLKAELNEKVPLSRIYKVLKSQPFFMYQLRRMKRFPRRRYDVKGFLELVQCDLAVMFTDKKGFNYFLLIMDVFTTKIWTYPMKKKNSKASKQAFEQFFKDVNNQLPTQIASDQGREFTSLKGI